jgi:hypothetical protein
VDESVTVLNERTDGGSLARSVGAAKGYTYMKLVHAATCLVFFLSFFLTKALSQGATSAATEQTAAVPATKLVLKEGTDVKLKFSDDLSSKTASEGDPVNLVLDEDLKVDDVVVVKAGAKATGTVTNAKKAGMMGKAGELNCAWNT